MKKFIIFSLLASISIAGCSFHPLGIDDDEWERMNPQAQMRAYEKQAELDKAEAEARAKERQAQAEAEARKYEAMAYMREHARYGDIVQCVLEPVEVRTGKHWRAFSPQAFDLVRGEQRLLELQDKKDHYSSDASVYFSASGLEVELCSGQYNSGDKQYCTQLLGTSRDFQRGIRQKFRIDRYMRGTLRCDLKPVRRSTHR
ncbi:MAG: hypothetical protein ACPGF7_04910 [Pontibacterium sp.]